MAKNRIVNTKIWDDKYFMVLIEDEKLLFLYFLTNALTNISGMYEIVKKRMSFDTGMSLERVDELLKLYTDDKKILYIDSWLCVINFIKNQTLNPSVIIGIEREVQLVPEDIRKKFISACKSLTKAGKVSIQSANKPKPTFDGYPMVYKKSEKKWYVIKGKGEWSEFVGDWKKDVVYK